MSSKATENAEELELTNAEFNDPDRMARYVWGICSKVDVSSMVNKGNKGGRDFNYLPWSEAWAALKNHFPQAGYAYLPDRPCFGNTLEVTVEIRIGTFRGFATLPVMNQSFRALENPDARAINDARQRCLVKAIAINTGLGLSLWSDDYDIPVGDREDTTYITAKQGRILQELLDGKGKDLADFLAWAGVDALEDLPQNKFADARKMLGGSK